MKRIKQDEEHPLATDVAWREALEKCLGEEALDLHSLAEQRQRTLGGQILPMGFGDFFFAPEDPLHPDLGLDQGEDEDDDEV